MAAAATVFEAVQRLVESGPELDIALRAALESMRRQPIDVAAKRDFEARLGAIAAAWEGVAGVLDNVRQVAQDAQEEHRALVAENAALKLRVTTLESDLREWIDEFEPDADPQRPAMFSNLRTAFRAFSR